MFSGDIYSKSMKMTTHVNIILPDESTDADPLGGNELYTLYLLHGLTANGSEWARFSNIEYLAKKYNVAIIMPTVDRSFYTDMAGGIRYFSYLTEDLPDFVSSWLRLPTDREHTLIAGESMGGYGACKAAFTRLGSYGGVATLSGALDLADFGRMCETGEFDLMDRSEFDLMFGAGKPVPESADVFKLLEKAAVSEVRPRLASFCGRQDFLADVNRRFDARATELGYDHLYMEWDGDHEWNFWRVAIQRALQYFLGYDLETTPLF